MKSFIFVALFAAAVAEPTADADAKPFYPYAAAGYAAAGYAYPGAAAISPYYATANAYNYGIHPATASAINTYGNVRPAVYAGYRTFGKRSADAEPKADPALLLANGYTAGYAGYPTTYAAAATYPAYNTYNAYNAYNTYGAYPSVASYSAVRPAVHYVGKRSADADADPALYYNAYAGSAYPAYNAYSGFNAYNSYAAYPAATYAAGVYRPAAAYAAAAYNPAYYY